MDLKERIQELCRQNNVSMNKVETDLGFGKGYTSKLGKSTPNATKIHKLADYFMVSVDYLMTGNEEADTSILSTRNERDIEKTLQSTLDQLDSRISEHLSKNKKRRKPAYLLGFRLFIYSETPGTRTPDNLIKSQVHIC